MSTVHPQKALVAITPMSSLALRFGLLLDYVGAQNRSKKWLTHLLSFNVPDCLSAPKANWPSESYQVLDHARELVYESTYVLREPGRFMRARKQQRSGPVPLLDFHTLSR